MRPQPVMQNGGEMYRLFDWLDSLLLVYFVLIFFVGYVVIDITMKLRRNRKNFNTKREVGNGQRYKKKD